MTGNDVNTLLLLHFDGSNGATVFTDDSVGDGNSPHSYSYGGSAQLDTSESEFGGSSLHIADDTAIVSYANSTDWAFGTGDFTIDCWVRFTSLGNNTICARTTSGTSYLYWSLETGNVLRFRDYASGNNIDIQCSWTPTINTWYHLAVVRSSGVIKLYIGGTSQTLAVNSGPSNSFVSRSVTFDIGQLTVNASYYMNGWIDEFRISNDARWTSNFTPPTSEYSAGTNFIASVLSLTSTLYAPSLVVDASFSSSLFTLTSTLHQPIAGELITVSPSILSLTSTLHTPTFKIDCLFEPPTFTLISTLFPIIGTNTVSNATAILSYNPLVIVMGTSPAKIAIVDVSSPDTPTWIVYILTGANNAQAVSYNSILEKIYVACDDGIIVEIDAVTPSSYSVINTGATGDLTSLAVLPNFFDIYAGTNYLKGEIINMYEGSSVLIGTNLYFSGSVTKSINLKLNTVNGLMIGTNLSFNELINSAIGCDIRFISQDFIDLSTTPISRLDFHVNVNGIELTDVKLDSIDMTHAADEKSMATFILARKHDNVDYMLDGTPSQITGHPSITITLNGHPEFGYDSPAYIWNIDTKSESETVKITAFSELPKQDSRNSVTLSLPGINDKLHIYHILMDDPTIDNPFILADDINPPFYQGILIDSGYQEVQFGQQNVNNWGGYGEQTAEQRVNWILGSGDSGIYDIDGNSQYFKPLPNYTYFWFVQAINWNTGVQLGGKYTGYAGSQGTDEADLDDALVYIGTSLSGLTSDAWTITDINFWTQRVWPYTKLRGGLANLPMEGNAVIYTSDLYGITEFNEDVLRNHGYTIYSGTDIDIMRQKLILASNPQTVGFTTGLYNTLNASTKLLDVIDSKFGVRFGNAPFKKVSCKNGWKAPTIVWEDQPDGLYLHEDAGYDYRNYINAVGNLELKKIQNINGSVLPKTKCDIEMFIDGYYNYGIALLKRINIDNTTTPNIYNGNNGFPVSVKSIHISSKDMKVTLNCTNAWSRFEMLEFEGQMPDPYKFVTFESRWRICPKIDPNTLQETS